MFQLNFIMLKKSSLILLRKLEEIMIRHLPYFNSLQFSRSLLHPRISNLIRASGLFVGKNLIIFLS